MPITKLSRFYILTIILAADKKGGELIHHYAKLFELNQGKVNIFTFPF
jgi:hypothetical protein